MSKFENIRNTFKDNLENHQGIFIYLPGLTDWQKKEAKFHDQIIADEKEVHQLNSLRNIFYHHYFKKWLYKLPADSVILEIGAGSGYDILPLVKKGYQLIESDISYQSVRFTKEQIEQNTTAKNQVIYLVSDGQNLPLENNSLEAVFLVAAFHHFQDQNRALAEIKRVTQKEGLIILAMEPTKFLMKFGKFFTKIKRLKIYKDSSLADETHQGYSKKNFKLLIKKNNLELLKIKRVWLTLGFIHYGLEILFRFLKLKKRLKLPRVLEMIFLVLDEILLKIPLLNCLNWHWIVILKKN